MEADENMTVSVAMRYAVRTEVSHTEFVVVISSADGRAERLLPASRRMYKLSKEASPTPLFAHVIPQVETY